jgi:hypothetical protein
VSGGIFLLSGEQLVEMREQAYDSEDRLQEWPQLIVIFPKQVAHCFGQAVVEFFIDEELE